MINPLRDNYQHLDAIAIQKSKALHKLCFLVMIVTLFLALQTYFNVGQDEFWLVYPFFGSFLLSFVVLVILYFGKYEIAIELFLVLSTSFAWVMMFIEIPYYKETPISITDTIVYIYSLLVFNVLISNSRKVFVPVYYILNIILIVIYTYAVKQQCNLSEAFATEYIIDNFFAFSILFIITNGIRTINEKSTRKIKEEVIKRLENEEKQKVLEEKLRQAKKMESLGTLAGGIAHDFNTLLGTIVGYTNIIATEISQDNPVQEDLKAITKVSLRAKEMIRQIQDFSNPKKIETEAVDIVSIVKSSMDLFRKTLPKTIVLKEKYPTNPLKIAVNESQINQVLLNLCSNAVDFTAGNTGTIKIEITIVDNFQPIPEITPGRFLNLSVSDTGIGIKEEWLEKIFEPYFTSKAIGKGSGLGLSVVYNVIHNHGGFVFVESEIGKGTRFDIYFPFSTAV